MKRSTIPLRPSPKKIDFLEYILPQLKVKLVVMRNAWHWAEMYAWCCIITCETAVITKVETQNPKQTNKYTNNWCHGNEPRVQRWHHVSKHRNEPLRRRNISEYRRVDIVTGRIVLWAQRLSNHYILLSKRKIKKFFKRFKLQIIFRWFFILLARIWCQCQKRGWFSAKWTFSIMVCQNSSFFFRNFFFFRSSLIILTPGS